MLQIFCRIFAPEESPQTIYTLLYIIKMDEKNYKILVVDDEQDLCEILKFNLETEGYLEETQGECGYGSDSYYIPDGSRYRERYRYWFQSRG